MTSVVLFYLVRRPPCPYKARNWKVPSGLFIDPRPTLPDFKHIPTATPVASAAYGRKTAMSKIPRQIKSTIFLPKTDIFPPKKKQGAGY